MGGVARLATMLGVMVGVFSGLASTQGITNKDILDGLSNGARWLTHSGDYTGPAPQPAHADHAGQRRPTHRAMDLPNRRARQVRSDAHRHRRHALCHRRRQQRLGDRRQNRPPALALSANAAAAGPAGVLRPRESRLCRAWRSALHVHARCPPRVARSSHRQGHLGYRDRRLHPGVREHRRPARREGHGDHRHRRGRVRSARFPRRLRCENRRAQVAVLDDSRAGREGQRDVARRCAGSAAAGRPGRSAVTIRSSTWSIGGPAIPTPI